MSIPGLSSVALRTTALLPFLAVLSACATAGPPGSRGRVGALDADDEVGPRVHLWTTDEFGSGNRVRPSFRLQDDAYVIVVNVALDGRASVLFPETPDDDGFMRGGTTYRLPAFFPGFANTLGRSRYGRLYNATSGYDDIYDRYAGYVFIIASWRPMHFEITEALGYWDDYRLAVHEQRLEPYAVMHHFAEKLVPGGARDYTARFARYAAFSGGFARRSSFARCSVYGSLFFGDLPPWVLYNLGYGYSPYGFGVYGVGAPGCGFGYGLSYAGLRTRGRPMARPPGTVPVRPTPPADSTGGDSVSKPRTPRPPRPPVAAGDSGERKSPRGRRVAVTIEEEPIIDVTNESRERARRAHDADRMRRGVGSERGYQRPGAWSRADQPRHSGDVRRDRAGDENARVRRREPVDYDRPRGESSRGESRASEPRRDAPARHEPRSEPRSQPTPRSEPASRAEPRSEPTPRGEPRSERPAKPVERQ